MDLLWLWRDCKIYGVVLMWLKYELWWEVWCVGYEWILEMWWKGGKRVVYWDIRLLINK